jgi:RNA polymerase sigma-70 factor (ECF subfamily)
MCARATVAGRGLDLAADAVTRVLPAEARGADLAVELIGHEAALLATARLLVGNEAEARDIVQQTLEIGLRRMDQLRDPARLGAWLTTIAVREAFRLKRRLKRLVSLDASVREISVGLAADVASLPLRDAVARLPDRIRAAVVLHYMVGLSVQETAKAMAVSENTVKTQLKTGLRRLRESLR